MLDIRRIRESTDEVRQGLASKAADQGLDRVLELDELRRRKVSEAEALKQERNTASKEIGAAKQRGEDITPAREAVRRIGDRIRALDDEIREVEQELETLLLNLPNPPHASSPVGASEAENVEVRRFGAPREFNFEPAPHWEVGERLGILDMGRAARLSGAGFTLLVGAGARLQRALSQFMLDLHVREHGYLEVAPPCLCNEAAMTGTSQLPKFKEDMYGVEGDDLYLVPTAEVPVTNIFREEIMDRDLPVSLTALTPCFRREAGAAGRETRGMNRVHQFEKVEMVRFVEPETSYEALEELVGHAEDVLQRLELPYRVIELCTGDLSFAAAKCYDIELWAPGQQAWLEVSSCSNFEDFQARRAGIRYRNAEGKPAFVHTLNGSGVALPRLLVALIENGQEADGSVTLPEAIRPYMDGLERIEPTGW